MTYVKQVDGTYRHVRNLGWILRNWQGIQSLEWTSNQDRIRWDGIFRAHMRDGRVYVTEYADFTVWKGFINRPVFRGLPVTVNGITGRV